MSLEAQILAELAQDGYTSGQAISHKLNISRSAVWKHIVKLREQGYVIEASPRNGYRLTRRPDRLLPAEIQPLLTGHTVGNRVFHYQKITSTADVARELIDREEPEGTVVVAEAQTRGRGRMGRTWRTPPGRAIALSVILYPRIIPTLTPLLSLGTALAVKRAVEVVVKKETGSAAGVALKWPNDIYLNGKKLGGVLLEMAAELDRVKWVIDSIGLNVNNLFRGTTLEGRATSLAVEFDRKFPRRDLVVALLDELDDIYAGAHTEKGLAAISREFEKHDLLQGKRVEVSTPDGVVIGTAAGIDSEGRLRVRVASGKVRAIFSGEATLSQEKSF